MIVPFENKGDEAFRRDVDGLSPELDLWVDRAVKGKQLRLDVKRTDWRVMTHLFTDDSDTEVRPVTNINDVIRQLNQRHIQLYHLYIARLILDLTANISS